MADDDIFKDFDALLWLRSKQGQYAGYPADSQDGIRHLYFKAVADELESLRSRQATPDEKDSELRRLRDRIGELNAEVLALRIKLGQEDAAHRRWADPEIERLKAESRSQKQLIARLTSTPEYRKYIERRDRDLCRRVENGEGYSALAAEYDLSPSRVRQVVLKRRRKKK